MAQTATRTPAAIVADVISRVFNGDLSVLDAHPGMQALRAHFPATKAAFPDIRAELQQQMVDGDRVATHWIFSGTHTGELYGIPPTGKPVRFQNVSIARVEGDRIVQYNSEVGWLTAFMQIGVLPARGGALGASSAPPDGASRLLAMSTGFWVSQILSAAAHYKLFTLISQGRRTAEAIAAAAGIDPRGTRMVLDSLVSLEVLTKRGDEYALTPDADACLVEGRPGDLTPMLTMHTELVWSDWSRLTETLKRGDATRTFADTSRGRDFFPKLIRAILPLSLGPADAVAEHLGIGTTRRGVRVLDIGAGSGAWSIPFAKRDRSATIEAFDLAEVLPETSKIVTEFGVQKQYHMVAGDLMKADFGSDAYDIVLLGNICHGLTPEQNRDLFARARRALAQNGLLIVVDMLPNEERTGPPFPVLFAVNMFVMGGADVYPLSDYTTWLKSAGYSDVTTFDTKRSHSPVILARK